MNNYEQLVLLIDKLTQILAAGLVSMFGGIAAYIYQNIKNERKFSIGYFSVIAFLAFFAGNLVGSFIPSDFTYKDGILMLTGYVSFPLLGALEEKGKDIIIKFIEGRIFGSFGESKKNDEIESKPIDKNKLPPKRHK